MSEGHVIFFIVILNKIMYGEYIRKVWSVKKKSDTNWAIELLTLLNCIKLKCYRYLIRVAAPLHCMVVVLWLCYIGTCSTMIIFSVFPGRRLSIFFLFFNVCFIRCFQLNKRTHFPRLMLFSPTVLFHSNNGNKKVLLSIKLKKCHAIVYTSGFECFPLRFFLFLFLGIK